MKELLHLVTQGLLYPTIIILLGLIIYALVLIGSIITEAIVERRHYKVVMPELIAGIDRATYEELPQVIERSGLLRSQKTMLKTLVAYGYLPEEARIALAKRLLADEEYRYNKVTSRTDMVSKIAPMLGLMGTLIPLGPGIQQMGQGQIDELASSIGVAFDTTVAGLVVAAIALFIGRFRKRWYEDYLITLEAAMDTILEKAHDCLEAGEDLGDGEKAAEIMRLLALEKKNKKAIKAAAAAVEKEVGEGNPLEEPVPSVLDAREDLPDEFKPMSYEQDEDAIASDTATEIEVPEYEPEPLEFKPMSYEELDAALAEPEAAPEPEPEPFEFKPMSYEQGDEIAAPEAAPETDLGSWELEPLEYEQADEAAKPEPESMEFKPMSWETEEDPKTNGGE